MKIKIITGFRDEQYYSIDAEEAHKAYYLFNNPDARTTFSNGVALIGKNIQGIEPAWNETMGWNPSHKLSGDDWSEIRSKGMDAKIRDVLEIARSVAIKAQDEPKLLTQSLTEARQLLLG